MSVKVIDRGWKRIKSQLKKADDSYVGIGLFADKVKETAQSSQRPLKNLNIAQVGAINEWGLPSKNIPSRPFLKIAYEKYKDKIVQYKANLLKKVYDGKITFEQGLDRLGLLHQGQIQRTIGESSLFEQNAPSTKKIKESKTRRGSSGSSKPLIDTGRMRQSITYEVKK